MPDAAPQPTHAVRALLSLPLGSWGLRSSFPASNNYNSFALAFLALVFVPLLTSADECMIERP